MRTVTAFEVGSRDSDQLVAEDHERHRAELIPQVEPRPRGTADPDPGFDFHDLFRADPHTVSNDAGASDPRQLSGLAEVEKGLIVCSVGKPQSVQSCSRPMRGPGAGRYSQMRADSVDKPRLAPSRHIELPAYVPDVLA